MTPQAARSTSEKIDFLTGKLEELSNRDYIGRQRLLLMLHELRSRVDDDCPAPQGQ